jgi:lipopolysaccharide biosynthesis glycosyltransferase
MSKTLNVLYQASNAYAPFMGVSILSLLKNNSAPNIAINVYVINDGITPENIVKIEQIVRKAGQHITFLDLSFARKLLEQHQVHLWRGSHATYLKLFAFESLPDEIARILYIDSDTIVTGDVTCLMDIDMRGNCIAMTQTNIMFFREILRFGAGHPQAIPFFNGAVILVDLDKWKRENVSKTFITRMEKGAFVVSDEDFLNVMFHNRILRLHQKFQSYPPLVVSTQELKEAEADPRIRHCLKFGGERPWDKGATHLFTPLYDEYLAASPWKDLQKKPPVRPFTVKIRKIIYFVFPKCIAWRLWLFATICETRLGSLKMNRSRKA